MDPDEWDESVLLHEFDHLAANRLDSEGELGNMITNSLTDSNKVLKESNYDRLRTTSAVDSQI